MGGWRDGWVEGMGGWRDGWVSYEVKNKRKNLRCLLLRRKKNFLYIFMKCL